MRNLKIKTKNISSGDNTVSVVDYKQRFSFSSYNEKTQITRDYRNHNTSYNFKDAVYLSTYSMKVYFNTNYQVVNFQNKHSYLDYT